MAQQHESAKGSRRVQMASEPANMTRLAACATLPLPKSRRGRQCILIRYKP